MEDDDLIEKELNEFFKNAMSSLNIRENSSITTRTSYDITDLIDKAIDKYKFYQSTLLIQKHLKNYDVFSFKTVTIGHIEKEINNINPKKHSHKKRKDNLETEIFGVAVRRIHQNSEKWWLL